MPLSKALAEYVSEVDAPSVRALSEKFGVPEPQIRDAMFEEDWEGQRKQYQSRMRDRLGKELTKKAKATAADSATAVDLLRAQVGGLTSLQAAVVEELVSRIPGMPNDMLLALQNVLNNQSSATVQRVMDFIGNMLADAADDSSQTRKAAVAALMGSDAPPPPPPPPPRRSLSVPTTQPDDGDTELEAADDALRDDTVRLLESEGSRGPNMGLLKRLQREE